eukprot:m.203808 g.203808  ORF g.203808 m.203808 type:complete len:363 (+) comp18863_c0_seq2:130-1218(+)
MSTTLLLDDIKAKQELIDKLQSSISHHSEAIKRLGGQLIELEESEKSYVHIISQIKDDLAVYTHKSTIQLEDVPSTDDNRLTLASNILLHRLENIAKHSHVSLSRIQKLQNELIEQNQLNFSIEQLEQAHEAQKAFLTSIQDQLKSASSRKRCIKRLETAIVQLETIVLQKSKNSSLAITSSIDSSYINSPAFDLLTQENSRISWEIDRALSETEVLNEIECKGLGIHGLEVHLNRLQDRYTDVQERNVLLARRQDHRDAVLYGSRGNVGVAADQMEEKTRSLQQQLLHVERAHAEELASLESKLLETKSSVFHGFSSAAGFILNESTGIRMHPTHVPSLQHGAGAQLLSSRLQSLHYHPDP